MINTKVRVIPSGLKNRCRTGDFDAIKETIGILFANKEISLRKDKESFLENLGYLSALEELELILVKR